MMPYLKALGFTALAFVLIIPMMGLFVAAINKLPRHQRRLFALFALGLTLYAGAKHGGVSYPKTDLEMWELMNDGSYTTNDFVHLQFVKNPTIPGTAPIIVECADIKYTNATEAVWTTVVESTFAEFNSPTNIPYANAWSNNWVVYTTYVRPPTAHTNGVAVLEWKNAPLKGTIIPYRTGIYTNGVQIAPMKGLK